MSLPKQLKWSVLAILCCGLGWSAAGCSSSSAKNDGFFGINEPPPGQVLRYVTGAEPESLDPQRSTGQPEARIYMALYEGLVEYDKKNMTPVPALAERWDSNKNLTEHTFYLRKNARWSDGTPITAQDFVYSLRRGLAPATASQSAEIAYYVKYAEAYNSERAFVRDEKNGKFVLEKELKEELSPLAGEATPTPTPLDEAAARRAAKRLQELEDKAREEEARRPPESEFHKFINGEARLTVPMDETERNEQVQRSTKLQKILAGKQFIPVKAEDIGIEAVDNYTVRITLSQPAPFFISALPNQFFRLVPRQAVEKYGDKWAQPENIVTCGAFRLKEWLPYNRLVVERDPNYWDAAVVKLNRIEFYPVEENPTIMNLYKTGAIDAALNHSVPNSWLAEIPKYKDYMKLPEAGNDFYKINTTKPPMNQVEVRKAFNMAVDKEAYAAWRRVVLPLTAFTPQGIFVNYPQPKGDAFNPEVAKKLLATAGYRDVMGNYDPSKFPLNEVEILYNTNDTNKAVAEFIQAQWRQNLGLTVPLRAMEWQTFLATIKKLDYKGFARGGWNADYMDPYTFLGLFYNKNSNGDTGWEDAAYRQMLDDANRQEGDKRYESLARAEGYLLNAQPFISLSTPSTNFMKKPYVKGFYPNPGSLYAWKYVYIEYDPAKWDQAAPKMTE